MDRWIDGKMDRWIDALNQHNIRIILFYNAAKTKFYEFFSNMKILKSLYEMHYGFTAGTNNIGAPEM